MFGSRNLKRSTICATGIRLTARCVRFSMRCCDRLTPEQAVHFAAQLPILVRGIYYKGWHLAAKPTPARHLDDFLARVAAGLPPQFPRDAPSVTKAVSDLLWRELDPGETAKVIASLPAALRPLWPEVARG
jgi:uncharacterized protein (DUF2267 family)